MMDSGNSASLQSSSGGDDEFDSNSRCGADSSSSPLSALLRQQPPSVPGFGGGSLIYGLQELCTQPMSSPSHWCSTTAPPLPASADASPSPPPPLPGHGGAGMAASSAAADQQAESDDAPATQAAAPAPPPRGSRKRARASRRAPTTVLTTDTSNFRAMVQEFTGIPSPPFARSRFDLLFPLRTTATAAAGTGSPATLPQYHYHLLRPFAQKLHASSTPYPPSFTSPSTSSPAPANISVAPASTTTTATGTTTVASASPRDSYHQLTAASTPSALLGMQQDHGSNNYHSFHQSSSLSDGKHPLFDRGLAPPPPAARLQDPADFLGLTHDAMVGSQGPHAHLHQRNGDELSGLVGAASVTGAGACKATYASTRLLLERNRRNTSADVSTAAAVAATTTAPVTVSAAGMRMQAGVVDSWVCTSDYDSD